MLGCPQTSRQVAPLTGRHGDAAIQQWHMAAFSRRVSVQGRRVGDASRMERVVLFRQVICFAGRLQEVVKRVIP